MQDLFLPFQFLKFYNFKCCFLLLWSWNSHQNKNVMSSTFFNNNKVYNLLSHSLCPTLCFFLICFCRIHLVMVHSVQQKSSGLMFRTSHSGSHVTYSCHHYLSRFSFPIFVNSWRFSVFHSLQTITPRIY